jgi:hypothetical protein
MIEISSPINSFSFQTDQQIDTEYLLRRIQDIDISLQSTLGLILTLLMLLFLGHDKPFHYTKRVPCKLYTFSYPSRMLPGDY